MATVNKSQVIILEDQEIRDFQTVMTTAYNKIVAIEFNDEKTKQRCLDLIRDIMEWEDD
jgi:hypothetical protein